jgi:glycosyltransferase involved in cell wall biosynthesis
LKVIFTIDSLQQGGAEQSLASLIRSFPPETEVMVLYFFSKHDLLPEFQSLNIRLVNAGLTSKQQWWKGMQFLQKQILEFKPNGVVSCLYWSNQVSRLVCKHMNVPLIGTLVSDSYSERRTNSFHFKRKLAFRFYHLLDRLTSGIPRKWIANSESIKKSNATSLHIDLKKIEVVYRGRDENAFNAWSSPVQPPFRFVFIGRLLETKGLKELLKAFHQLIQNHQNVQLEIFGDGPYRNTLEQLIQSLNLQSTVILHGRVNDAWKKLYQAHCFVFPSWYEGFSGALVEAMMTGIPIIASDIPMNLEAVTNHETASTFKVGDEKDLLNKMEVILNDYPNAVCMGNTARKQAITRFNQQTIAKQYHHILEHSFMDQ